MSAPPELVAFHLGIVVRDLDATIDRYRRMFGLDRWHVRDGTGARFAYGGRDGTGLAFELIQPVAGEPGQMSEFLAQRGEGVQHIGFWTPDLLGSLQAAVAEGATLLPGGFEQRGNTVVQLDMPPDAHAFRRALAFVDPGVATVRFELIGQAAEGELRRWLGDDFEVLLASPPW